MSRIKMPGEGPRPIPLPWMRLVGVLVIGILAIAAAAVWRRSATHAPPKSPGAPGTADPAVLREFLALESREAEAVRTHWAREEEAQGYGSRIETFWDQLNTNRGRLEALLRLPARSVTIPSAFVEETFGPGIHQWRSREGGRPMESGPSDPGIRTWVQEGWGLDQSEWRHVRYLPAANTSPPRSWFLVNLHLSRPSPPARAQVEARVRMDWPQPSSNDLGGGADVVVESLQVLRREGAPAFRLAWEMEVQPLPRTAWIDPLISVRPASNAGPSFLLAARNLRLDRSDHGTWTASALSAHHPGLIFGALLADFTGDGQDDLLFTARTGLLLLRGSADGFTTPAESAWQAPDRLVYAQAFTCGDMDADGDLDVFVGQYRTPYEGGQMPRPVFDAMDGPPAFLLRNVGEGRFEDVTSDSGLEPRRHRRSYGASFADLDGDGDLDLLVTSDFAGIDVHANDGHGRFTEVTPRWFDEVRALGMSHTLADFDSDGVTDLLLVGMPQPTADRLEALGLERPGDATLRPERSRLTFGNRLFFGGTDGFRQRPVGGLIARAGWAWTAAAADLDHDRFPDLYVANGHETRLSVRDYEREFWLHDIYVGDSTARASVEAYFGAKFAATRNQGWSYGGYDKNRLYLNRGGADFVEVGHLFGVALEADSRNVLLEDVDGDGDLDLLVTTFEVWPTRRQTLKIFENTLQPPGHWIELALRASPGSLSPVGATVALHDRLGRQVRQVVTGDGYRTQRAFSVRFGLGEVPVVEAITVHWPGGRVTHLTQLAADRRYDVACPPR